MKNYNEIRRLIKISYNGDNRFAINNSDILAAQDAISEANKQQIGFDEYISLHQKHLRSMGCSVDVIEEQLQRVKNITSYFTND